VLQIPCTGFAVVWHGDGVATGTRSAEQLIRRFVCGTSISVVDAVQLSWADVAHGPVATAVEPGFDALSTIAGSA